MTNPTNTTTTMIMQQLLVLMFTILMDMAWNIQVFISETLYGNIKNSLNAMNINHVVAIII